MQPALLPSQEEKVEQMLSVKRVRGPGAESTSDLDSVPVPQPRQLTRARVLPRSSPAFF